MQFLIKTLGLSWLLKKVYSSVRPELVEWAQADGEVDWDDAVVEILDKMVEAIAGKLEEKGK